MSEPSLPAERVRPPQRVGAVPGILPLPHPGPALVLRLVDLRGLSVPVATAAHGKQRNQGPQRRMKVKQEMKLAPSSLGNGETKRVVLTYEFRRIRCKMQLFVTWWNAMS